MDVLNADRCVKIELRPLTRYVFKWYACDLFVSIFV